MRFFDPIHLLWLLLLAPVRALNEDRPFDRFVAEQVAGDELAPKDFEMSRASSSGATSIGATAGVCSMRASVMGRSG